MVPDCEWNGRAILRAIERGPDETEDALRLAPLARRTFDLQGGEIGAGRSLRARSDRHDRPVDRCGAEIPAPTFWRWELKKSTSRSEQSVPQMQFELRRMLEEATGAKLTSIEDCSKELLAGPCVVYAWIASKPG